MKAGRIQICQLKRAANLLKSRAPAYDALMAAMARGAPVVDCVRAIEAAK